MLHYGWLNGNDSEIQVGKKEGRCQNVTLEKKKINPSEHFIEHHWRKNTTTICERPNQRSDQMSNGPSISFEDTAVLALMLSNPTYNSQDSKGLC